MMSNLNLKQTDINAASGKGLEKILNQLAVLTGEAIKAIAKSIKFLIKTFLGK